MAPNNSSDNTPDSQFFLPDFCGLRSLFAMVVLVELFAFVLTLAAAPQHQDLWSVLGLYSLFMQWVGMLSAGILCLARRPLSRLSDTLAGLISYALLLLIITLLSLAANRIMALTGFPSITGNDNDFLLQNLAIGAIACALILRYFYISHQWQQRIRTESRAKLEALQARIRPHFLFNSINTISSLIHDKPDEAEEALLDLADLFRANLREERQLIPLADEVALTRRYLSVESLRLGERLQQQWQLEEGSENLLLPPLILQPLVENAVYHGIEPREHGGAVTIAIKREGERLNLAVSNPLPDTRQQRSESNHIALENIRDRLTAHYGKQASLHIDEDGESYRVQLCLPIREHAA